MKKQIRITLLALAALVTLGFGGWFLIGGLRPPTPTEPPPAESESPPPQEAAPPKPSQTAAVDTQRLAAFVEKLSRVPEYQAFFARFRVLYPAIYNAALREALARNIDKRKNPADFFLAESVGTLRQNRGLDGAMASGAALDRLFDAHFKVMRALAATDASLCVDFLNGAPAERFVAFAGDHRALMADEAMAGLNAIDDGAQQKIARKPPNDQDFDDLEKLLRKKGLNKAAIDLLLDGKTPNPPLSDAQMCQNGLVYLAALKNLPAQPRMRLYALALEVMSGR